MRLKLDYRLDSVIYSYIYIPPIQNTNILLPDNNTVA